MYFYLIKLYSALLKGMFELFCNFSGIYRDEEITDSYPVLDFSGMEGTECFCSDEAASEIRSSLNGYPYSGIHWIDGGDYHYMTLFWLEKIDRDFVLVLFDNHPDDQDTIFGPDLISCGSWVKNARLLPSCRRVCHIRKVSDLPALPRDAAVYFSVDKDVLSPEYARTNWDQGTMTLEELFSAVSELSYGRTVLGVDICGGLSVSKGASPADIAINRRTDMELDGFLKKLLITE